MIFDTLDQYARYTILGGSFPAAMKFLMENDLTSLPAGRIEIDGDNLFAVVQEYLTKPARQGLWEAHRRYIDIQYIASGQERMGFANLQTMQLGEYFPEKDYQALTGAGNYLDAFARSFAIFVPEDGHMPGLCIKAPEAVKKVVLKVKLRTV